MYFLERVHYLRRKGDTASRILTGPLCLCYPSLAQAHPSKGRGVPLVSQVNPHWPEWPSPETVVLGGKQRRPAPPQPSQCGHLQGRGRTKYSEREIEASPIGGSHSTPGERLPFSGLRGPSTGPLCSPCPLQSARNSGFGGRGLAPRGVSPRAALELRESAQQPEQAAGWAHLGRAKRFSRDRKQGTRN